MNPQTTKDVCRYCGCTDENTCRYVPNLHAPPAGQPVLTAEWADKTKTLCTNPACLEKAEKEQAARTK